MTTRTLTARTLLAAGGVLLVITVATGCSDAAEDNDPESKSFAFSGEQLTVIAKESDLRIKSADVDKVEVTRWFSAYSVIGDTPEAKWSMQGGTLRLTVDCGPGIIVDCDAQHEVLVPEGVAVKVNGDNGKVEASGFRSALDLDSDNGAVKVSDVSGRLKLHSDNGKVEGTRVGSHDVQAESDNGKIKLTFSKAPDRVVAKSDNGSITVHVPSVTYAVHTKASNGDVDVDIPVDPKSKRSIDAESDNGHIGVHATG